MKTYTYATVLCVCGRQVARVPRDPGRIRRVCGMRLYFIQTGNRLRPFAETDKTLRGWNPRRPAILAAG